MQQLHYENITGMLVRRDGKLHWRCPECKQEGASEHVLRECPECKRPPQAAKTNPLEKRCYLMSESHLSGYRLVIGFETLEDVQDAYEYVTRLSKTPNANMTGLAPAQEEQK